MNRLIKYSFGSTIAAIGIFGGLGGLNLYTYHRFTDEASVARLKFDALGERAYRVTIEPDGESPRQLRLEGDEWQLDVRMIKWKDWLTFLGESPLYRLDRLSGRYVSIEDARAKGQTLHALSDAKGVDVWAFARRAGAWLPGVDASYGSSVYLPMADGLTYQVTISRTGLLARQEESGNR